VHQQIDLRAVEPRDLEILDRILELVLTVEDTDDLADAVALRLLLRHLSSPLLSGRGAKGIWAPPGCDTIAQPKTCGRHTRVNGSGRSQSGSPSPGPTFSATTPEATS
jgi:hypothetical protein